MKCFNEKFEKVKLSSCYVRRFLRTKLQLKNLYTRLIKKEINDSEVENKRNFADDVLKTESESELEKGEIREDLQPRKCVRSWEL